VLSYPDEVLDVAVGLVELVSADAAVEFVELAC
jgi:hypothetical protein